MIVRIIPKRQRRRAPEASEQSLYRSSHWKYHQRKKDPLDDTFDTKAASIDDNYGTMMCNCISDEEKPMGTENLYIESVNETNTVNHELTEDDSNEQLSAMLRYAAATSHEDVFNIIDRCIERELINDRDENGWTALHEAVRRGDARVVETLIQAGADVTLPTNFGEGHTPLQLALSMHGEEHSVSKILRGKEREGYDGDDYNYNM